jgi:hypothetical protein
LDALVVVVLAIAGTIGFIYLPDHHLAALAIPGALVVLFETLRWG